MKELKEIRNKLDVPKDQFNSFGNYNYRSCEDILNALKPLLKETDCLLTITDTLENIGDRYYVKATVTVTNEDKEEVVSNGYARESLTKKGMDESQITGSASSYARKYALNALFLIDDTKDADSMDNTKEVKTYKKPVKTNSGAVCEMCGDEVSDKVKEFSEGKFGKILCYDCQNK